MIEHCFQGQLYTYEIYWSAVMLPSFSLFDHLKDIPVIIFVTAMIVRDALRAFAHQAKQGWTSLQCLWHHFPGFHPGMVGNEGQAGLHWS